MPRLARVRARARHDTAWLTYFRSVSKTVRGGFSPSRVQIPPPPLNHAESRIVARDSKKPWVRITISQNAWPAHQRCAGSRLGGCSETLQTTAHGPSQRSVSVLYPTFGSVLPVGFRYPFA